MNVLALCFCPKIRERLSVLSDDVPLVVSRQLLQTFAQELGRLQPETQKEIAHYILAQIQPRVVSFEEQVRFSPLIISLGNLLVSKFLFPLQFQFHFKLIGVWFSHLEGLWLWVFSFRLMLFGLCWMKKRC